MPEIEVRPVEAEDVPALAVLDHTYTSEYVLQMELQQEEGGLGASFRQVRLPRSVRVEYPRQPAHLVDDWQDRSGVLVACLEGEPVGYISLMLGIAPLTTWVTDLAVRRRLRRQGIGTALLLAAQEWGLQHGTRRLILEMQPKNFPAVQMAQKLGFDFCGYNDRYYANHDIALFFAKSLR